MLCAESPPYIFSRNHSRPPHPNSKFLRVPLTIIMVIIVYMRFLIPYVDDYLVPRDWDLNGSSTILRKAKIEDSGSVPVL